MSIFTHLLKKAKSIVLYANLVSTAASFYACNSIALPPGESVSPVVSISSLSSDPTTRQTQLVQIGQQLASDQNFRNVLLLKAQLMAPLLQRYIAADSIHRLAIIDSVDVYNSTYQSIQNNPSSTAVAPSNQEVTSFYGFTTPSQFSTLNATFEATRDSFLVSQPLNQLPSSDLSVVTDAIVNVPDFDNPIDLGNIVGRKSKICDNARDACLGNAETQIIEVTVLCGIAAPTLVIGLVCEGIGIKNYFNQKGACLNAYDKCK